MKSARLSLLIPCYNGERFLSRLYHSVAGQTVPFDEIILYDSGSTDVSASMAHQFGWKVLHDSRPRGPAFARNRLAEAASGEWLHFHDVDDVMSRDFVESVGPLMNSSHDVIINDADWIDEKSGLPHLAYRYSKVDLEKNPLTASLINPIGGIVTTLRKIIFHQINGFNESLKQWEDADLHVRLALAGARFTSIPKVLSIAYRQETSASSDQKLAWKSRVICLEHYLTSIPPDALPVVCAEAELAAAHLLQLKDSTTARRALQISLTHQSAISFTQNPVMLLVARFLSAWWAFRLQTWWRSMP